MDRRLQVFISSTYLDLKKERQEAQLAVLKLRMFPAGMELFAASDDSLWNYIKRLIDESDIYLLMVGGRYGSICPDGRSWTEREYDYAVESGKDVVPFLLDSLDRAPKEFTDHDPRLCTQLGEFRAKVSKTSTPGYWGQANLGLELATSLAHAMNSCKSPGWVRATTRLEDRPEYHDVVRENEALKLASHLKSAPNLKLCFANGASSHVAKARYVPKTEYVEDSQPTQQNQTFLTLLSSIQQAPAPPKRPIVSQEVDRTTWLTFRLENAGNAAAENVEVSFEFESGLFPRNEPPHNKQIRFVGDPLLAKRGSPMAVKWTAGLVRCDYDPVSVKIKVFAKELGKVYKLKWKANPTNSDKSWEGILQVRVDPANVK